MAQQFKSDVRDVGDRVTHIEEKMGEFTSTFNELVDTQNEQEDDLAWIRSRLEDLEDRSRRSNVKIHRIPKSVKSPSLKAYLFKLLQEALPDAPLEELTINSIHRLTKPKHIPAHLPRYKIVCIHYFHIKEKLVTVARNTVQLPDCLQGLSIFVDLSAYTMQQKKEVSHD